MKYIIMCGGNYKDKFDKPKQLLKVNNEVLVERTVRLLKENGIEDIAISTNCKDFDYLKIPILKQNNQYKHNGTDENKKSTCCWLNAYYPMDEPCCYLYGDVYYSEGAIQTIIQTKVKDTMYFCVRDLHDGRPTGVNAKGREPLAYKVQNYKLFRNAIDDILRMVDEGKFKNAIAPFSWHLYRYINGLEYISNNLGYINNIFKTNGDYIVIDDYSTDVDSIEDIEKIEQIIKIMKGEVKMVKVEVKEEFTLGKYNELKNIVRKGKNETGRLFAGDVFECTEDMAKYLTGNNPLHRPVVKVLEVIPETAVKKVETEKAVKKTTKRTTRKTTKKD